MENTEMKKCPYCAEMIKSEAIKCRYCGSNLSTKNPLGKELTWQRINKGKRVAGVCTGIAEMFNVQTLILPMRLFFMLTTIIYGFGLILYIALWILMEKPTDQEEEQKISNNSTIKAEIKITPEQEKTAQENTAEVENKNE